MSLAALLTFALLLDALLGEPDWLWARLPHPAVLMGRFVAVLDKSLNQGQMRRLKGVLALSLLVLSAGLVAIAIGYAGPLAEVLVAAILLAQRSLADHVAAVATGLATSVKHGRDSVAMIVGRDTGEMGESEVARAAIESAAENLSDGVIAPAFWFLVAGLPGIMIYKAVNTADSMIGYRTDRHAAFGWAAARLDDLLNLVPARLTAFLIAICAGQRDLAGILRDARLHRSPNAGWPEAAMSRALGIALSGPRSYEGRMQDFPWVHEAGRKTANAADIHRSVTILWKAWGAVFLISACLAFFLQ